MNIQTFFSIADDLKIWNSRMRRSRNARLHIPREARTIREMPAAGGLAPEAQDAAAVVLIIKLLRGEAKTAFKSSNSNHRQNFHTSSGHLSTFFICILLTRQHEAFVALKPVQ
jgi:hypothetical protein